MSYPQRQQSSHQPPLSRRKAPGILRLLPENLPFYPYREATNANKQRRLHLIRRKQRDVEKDNANNADDTSDVVVGDGHQSDPIPNAPLHRIGDKDVTGKNAGFTLFFFVDSTNRHSLLAVPLVSQWFHHALNDMDESCGSRVICIPNQRTPNEISLGNLNSDPIVQASINSSTTSVTKQQIPSMLLNTGFYHLPFLHPKRLALLHLVGATRVPCVIVVSNVSGRIVTHYGLEAIKREDSCLKNWIDSRWIENTKCDGDKLCCDEDNEEGFAAFFESQIAKEWSNGNSGLPLWWHLLSWVL